MARFPFCLFYIVQQEYVHIIGCMCTRRDPDEWLRLRGKFDV